MEKFKIIICKIPLFRYYFLGKEYTKNPPSITLKKGNMIEGADILNVTIRCCAGTKVVNNKFRNTIPTHLFKRNKA